MTDQPPAQPSRPDQRQEAAGRLAQGQAQERARLEAALADETDDGVDWNTVRPDEDVDLGDVGLSRWAGPALLAALVVVIVGGGWAFLARDGDDDIPVSVAPSSAAETVTDSTPQPLGQSVQIGDWVVTVVAWNPDAAAEVQDRNPNNRAPDDGEVFGLATVELERTGERAVDAFDLSFRLVDDTLAEYPDYESRCGVVPDGIDKFIPLEPGDSARGAVCFALPADKAGLVDLLIGPAVDLDAAAVTFDLP